MFSLPILVALAVVAVVTSFISGIFGMAGGLILMGILLALLPVASVVALRKDSVSLPAPAAILDQLAAESDYVLSAMGD